MIHKASVVPPASPPPDDDDTFCGKGVGPHGSVELGRAKYWAESPEPPAQEPQEEGKPAPARKPSYFREAMMGFPEPEAPFDPVPRP